MGTDKPIALVTGSSRGIGKAIALELAKTGYTVIITGTKQDTVNETVSVIEKTGGSASGIAINLTEKGAPHKLIEEVISRFGQLDVLINNAGLAKTDPFIELTEDDFDRIMRLNVKVPTFLTQAALPYLLKSPEKAIVNISSVVGHKAYANQTMYSASKHALNGLMSALAKEYRTEGLRVYKVAPGGVATEMIHTARPDLDASTLIQPEDVAKAVSFLLSLKGNAQIDEIKIRRKDNVPYE